MFAEISPYVKDAIEKYISIVPKNIKIDITKVISSNKEFNITNNRQKKIRLYHVIREDNDRKRLDIANDIIKNGFMIHKAIIPPNKGFGIYFAEHANYSLFWGTTKHNVVISNVDMDDRKVKRYISEIYSETNNNEYVVSDESIIEPICYLELSKQIFISNNNTSFWTNPKCEKCNKTQSKYLLRCDCQQYPTFIV